MSPRRSFFRKIAYLVAVGLLLLPLFWLSRPATSSLKDVRGSEGGQLALLRAKYGLSEAQLGEIDPTSETIKLATLGMRGVAANILWEKAFRYKKKKDWTNLSATLNQITKLEPHFVSVWEFQAHNLSYNVSAEFDDYRERYRWAIKGIEFLKEGIRFNQREPRLKWFAGWIISHKIGRADEAKQFRQMFKSDDDFHANDEEYHGLRPREFRDNWLVGKYWFAAAERLVESGQPLKGAHPVVFFSDRPKAQMDYAEALERDGVFGEKARRAWNKAYREWTDGPLDDKQQIPYGSRLFSTDDGTEVRLNDREMYWQKAKKLRAELDSLEPGLRERITQEKMQALTGQLRQALYLPLGERTEEQQRLHDLAESKVEVTDKEVASRITGPNRSKALRLAEQTLQAERMVEIIDSYRQIVNFNYWRRRALVEQTPEVLAAREYICQGDQAFPGDLVRAREMYDKGLAKWRQLLDKQEFRSLATDMQWGEDFMIIIRQYRQILEKRDEQLPEDFVLRDVMEYYERIHGEQ